MDLLKKIEEDLKKALKAQDKNVVSTLRFLLAAIRNFEIEKQKEITDEEVIQIIQKQIKLRKESIAAFQAGGRQDLAQKEESEAEILSKYLPQQLTEDQLREIVDQTIKELKAGRPAELVGPQDFGKVMREVMVRVKGKAEGSQVAEVVKKTLQSFN